MDVKLRVEDLVKIFGNAPRKEPLRLLRAGATKEEILQKTGHVVGVNNASFSVEAGEIFVVMGLSGSGKSTLIRCLNRLIGATSGHVYLDGEDILAADKARLQEIRRTRIAMVFQHFGLFPHKTVVDNVAYGLKTRGISVKERREKAEETLAMVGLKEWADHYPHNLSGGMQQRVGLARALATDPDILLMDEAFSALDPLIRRQMQDELLRLQERLQKTVVFITHDLNEALRVGNHVAVMRDGSIVQIGTPAEIVTQPADKYVAEFTQDVDQGRVLSAEFVMSPARTLVLGRDTVSSALGLMKDRNTRSLYVINSDGRPEGVVHRHDLLLAQQQGVDDLSRSIQANFPRTARFTPLTEIYGLVADGMPVAVLNDEGGLHGVIDPLDVLASLAVNQNGDANYDEESQTKVVVA